MAERKELHKKKAKKICTYQFAFLKEEAAAYLNELLRAVMLASQPNKAFQTFPLGMEDKNWKDLPDARRRNVIELFFWAGRHHNHRTIGLLNQDALPVSEYF